MEVNDNTVQYLHEQEEEEAELNDEDEDDEIVTEQQQSDEEVQYMYIFMHAMTINHVLRLLQETEAVLKSGLKRVPCKEDDEFMAEYEKMMNDSQQVSIYYEEQQKIIAWLRLTLSLHG